MASSFYERIRKAEEDFKEAHRLESEEGRRLLRRVMLVEEETQEERKELCRSIGSFVTDMNNPEKDRRLLADYVEMVLNLVHGKL